jgi:Omp85 superfamily domain
MPSPLNWRVLSIVCAALLVVVPFKLWAEEEQTDLSCQYFYGHQEKVVDAKESRIDSNLFVGLETKRIRYIQYNTISVFDKDDPEENNALYLFFNKLHINTRKSVIARQLLFKEGELIDEKKIQETERILRRRDYLTDAYIVPVVVCADHVDLMVVTKDSWALEPQISLKKESQGTKSGFAIADGNIFGTGSSLTVGYEENAQRNLVSYEFKNPHIFNSNIATKLLYADTSDGRNIAASVERPFYSLETPWATGIATQDITLEEPIRQRDEQINEFRHQVIARNIYLGKATDINSDFTQRWLLGVSHEEDNFSLSDETLGSIPMDRQATYPWVEYQYRQNRFAVYKNINQIQRPEDIGLGYNVTFRFGYAGTSFDNSGDVFRYVGELLHNQDFDENNVLQTSVTFNGRYFTDSAIADANVIGLSLDYHHFEDDKNRWYYGLIYNRGYHLAQYEELTLGDITGLRGYPTDFQRGDERFLFSIERRYFSDVHIFSIMRVGLVAFFDVGRAWGLEDQYGKSELLSDVGFGLRLSSTKVRIGKVVHVDIATPLAEKNGIKEYQLSIGAQTRF